jgi:hypothetical protein
MTARSAALSLALVFSTPLSAGEADPRLFPQYNGAECAPPGALDGRGAVVIDYGGTIGRQYNPVTIAQVAIGCYHVFIERGDRKARKTFLDQVEWLKANAVPGPGPDMAAYEYRFPWSYGLKPGWRSGLAQGQAISALVRYVYETGDESVKPFIRQLKNYMLLPKADGGVTVTSPEGGMWIEEFPSEAPSFVLNGFVSATFGLYEYTRLFPEDDAAKAQLADAVASIKAALPHYDAGDWTYLDRRSQPYPKAVDSYAWQYVGQMRSLWQISGDSAFLQASLRWASFCNDVNFARGGNMKLDEDGVVRLHPILQVVPPEDVLPGNVEVVEATPTMPGYGADQLFDANFDTYMAPAAEEPSVVDLRLKTPQIVNAVVLRLYNVELYPERLTILAQEPGSSDWVPLDHRSIADRRNIIYYFREITAGRIRIQAMRSHGQNRLVIADLMAGRAYPPSVGTPEFATYLTPVFPVLSGRFSIRLDVPNESTGSVFVIYRHADKLSDVEQAPWVWDALHPSADEARERKAAFYQFKVLATREAGERGVAAFRVVAQGGPTVSPPSAERPSAQPTSPAASPPSTMSGPTLLQQAFRGQEITIRFDPQACTTFNLGTIQCGSEYKGRYAADTNRWTVSGFHLGDQQVRTVATENAERKPGSVSVWGLIATFDDKGDLYYLGQRVGTVRGAE